MRARKEVNPAIRTSFVLYGDAESAVNRLACAARHCVVNCSPGGTPLDLYKRQTVYQPRRKPSCGCTYQGLVPLIRRTGMPTRVTTVLYEIAAVARDLDVVKPKLMITRVAHRTWICQG